MRKAYDDTLATAGERLHVASIALFKECAKALGLVRLVEWLAKKL